MVDKTVFKNANELLQCLSSKNKEISTLPIDIELICKLLGISLVVDPTLEEKKIIGQIEMVSGHPTIKINLSRNMYRARRRFTIAHEIGHYCLHTMHSNMGFIDTDSTIMNKYSGKLDTYEKEANRFATELLMPYKLIISKGEELSEDRPSKEDFVRRMVDAFDVSFEAMRYRLKNIGILD